MTDREAAAGLVERLENRIRVYEMTPNSRALDAELHRLSRTYIATLLSELERVGKERDACFQSADANALAANSAEARALKAEKERDSLKLQAQCHAMEARSANATIYDAYQAVTGATGEPGNWNGAEPIKAELDRLRALVAEAAATERAEIRKLIGSGCPHDGGFDCEVGPIGCYLDMDPDKGCVCRGIATLIDQRSRAFIEKAKS